MAPRSAKTKKAAESKVATSEAPKKGRGKAKTTEEETDAVAIEEVEEEIYNKKSTRGRKAANGDSEEVEPVVKQGRKKKAEDTTGKEKSSKKAKKDSPKEGTPQSDDEHIDDIQDANGQSEKNEAATTGRGRKKPTKKENGVADKVKQDEDKPKSTSRGKKNIKPRNDSPDSDEIDDIEPPAEKPKSTKGRGKKAQAKAENDEEKEESEDRIVDEIVKEEDAVEPAVAKGKKKAKAVKEKTPDAETMESDEKKQDEEEEQDVDPPQKKAAKGRKNQGKKAQVKEVIDAEKDEDLEEEEEPASKKTKAAKKVEKGKGDSEDVNDEEVKAKPAKNRRAAKKATEVSSDKEEESQDPEPIGKRQRKAVAVEDKAADDGKKKAPAKNKATTNYDGIDFANTSTNEQGKRWNFKIASWNVDGIRAWMTKGGLDYLKYEKPDILCLQEVKCGQEKIPDEILNVPGYHAYWQCSDGYAGVGIYTTKMAMNVQYGLQDEELDREGRIITAEYEQFYLICTYVPNAGRKLITLPKRLKWNEEFRKYVKALDEKKPVIICGDMNVAHNEIDLTNPKTNKKNAGFTVEERTGMTELLGDGYVDTYRRLYPDNAGAYTFWTYMMNSRSKNVGWRLDYFIVSEKLMPSLCDNVIRSEVFGSDHCPIALFLHLPNEDKPKE